MICFEISINGKKLCLAGLEFGLLTAHLMTWQEPPGEDAATAGDRELKSNLHISGVMDSQHYRWTQPGEIGVAVGDEVTIRIVESDTPDAGTPHERKAKAR